MTIQERRLSCALVWFGLIIGVLVLGGCTEGSLTKFKPTSTSPICKAVIGPIKYNSQKPASRRFAGPALAPDLKQRNQVGQQLGCPAYK